MKQGGAKADKAAAYGDRFDHFEHAALGRCVRRQRDQSALQQHADHRDEDDGACTHKSQEFGPHFEKKDAQIVDRMVEANR